MSKSNEFGKKTISSKNKNCQFYLFFPPCSTLRYALIAQESPKSFEEILEFRNYLAQRLAMLDNVELYFFQNKKEIVDDLSNYTDPAHYSDVINTFILKSINKKEYLFDQKNSVSELHEFKDMCQGYKMPSEVNLFKDEDTTVGAK